MTQIIIQHGNLRNSIERHSIKSIEPNYREYGVHISYHYNSSSKGLLLKFSMNYRTYLRCAEKQKNIYISKTHLISITKISILMLERVSFCFYMLVLVSSSSPNVEDHERKKRVIDFVVHSRRQLIKLLVLVKWSSNSLPVHKIMSIVGFLQRQNNQFERNVNILKASKENFHSARMRNYDLPTALQVLTNGYPTLPGSLTDQFDSKPKLTDSEVIKIMHDLNELISFRLASSEVIPREFRSYRIYDGRVVFKIGGMFECSLTLGGGELDSQWYLLHVEFLFKVTGPRGKDFMGIPQGAVKNQIIESGNRIMAPVDLPTESDPDPKPPERPIMKLFAYLRDLCLNYQLEALHYQASQLGRSAWASHTKVLITTDRRNLTIMYWSHARPVSIPVPRPGQQLPKNPPQPTPQGTLTIRRHIELHSPSRRRVTDFLNEYPLKDKHPPSDGEDEDFGASQTERLQVIWKPIELTNATGLTPEILINQFKIRPNDQVIFTKRPAENGLSSMVELELRMDELCLDSILQRVVRVHTDCTLRRAFFDLTRIDRPLTSTPTTTRAVPYFASVRLVPWDEVLPHNSERFAKSIEVVLHARHTVEILIDQFSGRFRLQSTVATPPSASTSHTSDNSTSDSLGSGCFSSFNNTRLSFSDVKINANPSTLRDVLVRLKSDILLDQIEFKARLLGMKTTRNLPIQLQNEELKKLTHQININNHNRTVITHHINQLTMFCKLSNFDHHYLMIMVSENGIKCALIIVNQYRITSGNSSNSLAWNVHSVSPVDVPPFAGDSDDDGGALDQFTLSRTQLRYVYHYCLIQVTLNQLKGPLMNNGISYEHILPLTRSIIQRQRSHQEQRSIHTTNHSSSSSIQLPTFHPSHEVTGLLSIPLQGFLKPSFLNNSIRNRDHKNIFDCENLAVRVVLNPASHFGVQVEVQFKFNPGKLSAEELEKIMRSKEINFNKRVISHYLMKQQIKLKSQSNSIPTLVPSSSGSIPMPSLRSQGETSLSIPNSDSQADPQKNGNHDDEDSDEDEEPLSKRISTTTTTTTATATTTTAATTTTTTRLEPNTKPKVTHPITENSRQEGGQDEEDEEDERYALLHDMIDELLIDSDQWSIDPDSNHFSMRFLHFTTQVDQIYNLSILKFFHLLHSSSGSSASTSSSSLIP
ncbi:hypothetical protein PSTT_10249 [Puccinia striiformis]|uniref:Mediator of RNA polymerase II transcription subunit 14 n=1 Tax=Puccinia striiformis TaxID=27350 RepID=A0A2S4V554_9BASI|nr:hypothetical protein PSTT_10249 [Puccinia striiformis]